MLNSFVHAESLEDEVQRLQTYPSSYVKQLLSQGQDLAELASVGKVKEIALTLSTLREGELLQWTTVNMFRNSVRKGKTNVMEYMLDNGFQLKSPGLRHILHELLLECANGDCKEEHLTLSTILLVQRGFDVNTMHANNSMTPLHLACMHRLKILFKLFICSGADIHAIDDNDMTPSDYAKDPFMKSMLLQLGAQSFQQYKNSRQQFCTYSA